jgi:hypothetical protein
MNACKSREAVAGKHDPARPEMKAKKMKAQSGKMRVNARFGLETRSSSLEVVSKLSIAFEVKAGRVGQPQEYT